MRGDANLYIEITQLINDRKDAFLKECKNDEQKAALLADLVYCIQSNKPTFNMGKSAEAFNVASSSVIQTYEYDIVDLITSMDPDRVTRLAQTLYISSQTEVENLYWRVDHMLLDHIDKFDNY